MCRLILLGVLVERGSGENGHWPYHQQFPGTALFRPQRTLALLFMYQYVLGGNLIDQQVPGVEGTQQDWWSTLDHGTVSFVQISSWRG